ncbi:hypothetical protein [Lactobacillus ultunensis]|uniref:Uncharacterized protein n=1 Tax=Lactobacillus ultunensis DSM 16047 TaxID=525365 RepID=C2ELF8_9LACO|nr:hypothetical protein [Lactobacillus ultunensis]EEJ72606.1 hypothetical protein HMPREF0548_0504 [Lactobacillus ultunensis DSM 16047]KRL81251.1 hypothetical protein FC57_GL000782 [Lactobacillus ultunensis DSM 16047]QQP28196.1 hypothetical protein H4B44_08840 [Lactobacillus ultunensis]
MNWVKIKYFTLALIQRRELIHFLQLPTKGLSRTSQAYYVACDYNSYMRMTKVKLSPKRLEVKIRIPEYPDGMVQLEKNWPNIIDKISRLNFRRYTLSSDKTSDPNYYIIEGTRK